MTQKNKKIEKINVTSTYHGISFIDESKLTEALVLKINELIDAFNKLNEKE